MRLDEDLFTFIFHHVFFPPKLPQTLDRNLPDLESKLLGVVQDVLQDYIAALPLECRSPWEITLNMLGNWIKCDTKVGICKKSLERVLSNIESEGAVACHIRQQNCGWMACFDKDKRVVIVDAFEVSAQGKSVLAAAGGLLRHFPGVSVVVPSHKFADPMFASFLASNLSQLASEEVSAMIPQSSKAGVQVDEHRETTHPGLVTEGLMIQLLAYGSWNEDTPFVKCVRDERNWKRCLLPWRRSPSWLVFRVALQMILRRRFPAGEGKIQYKNFMLYLMADLGEKALSYTHSDRIVDYLAVIRSKLAHRMTKLNTDSFPFVDDLVQSTAKDLLHQLSAIQRQIRRSDRSIVPHIPSTATPEDLQIALINCQKYLDEAMHSTATGRQPCRFDRLPEPRFERNNHGLPVLRSGSTVALSGFENWIDVELQNWFSGVPATVQDQERACRQVGAILESYLYFAEPAYASDPHSSSRMILVILDLWTVLDRMAVKLCPLLNEFSPEIPVNFLEPLLLPTWSQMQRAGAIENHLRSRHHTKMKNNPSIFSDPTRRAFAVQFFDSSEGHQNLYKRIEDYGKECESLKRREWERLSKQYEELFDKADAEPEHLYQPDEEGIPEHKGHSCKKCSLERQANSLKIGVYESLLPKDDAARKTAVFELNPPQWFVSWRDITWKILHDVANRQTKKAQSMQKNLLDHEDLKRFMTRHSQRLTLGSCTKAFVVSHYGSSRFPTSLERVCVPNAFQFRLLDTVNLGWVTEQDELSTIKRRCTLQIPTGLYSNQQFAVDSSRHTQNQVMTDQQKCDAKLNLHEFVAYGCLRAGERVQWYNILRELASSTLSFSEEAVVILFKQTAWELGSPSFDSDKRTAHQALEDPGFDKRLLDVLDDRLTTIERNWNKYCTLDVLVALGLRVLALTDDYSSIEAVVKFIRRCRQVAIRWCQHLNHDFHNCNGDEGRRRQHLIIRIAAICHATYDVELRHIKTIFDSTCDLFCLVRSSMLLFENTPSDTTQFSREIQILLQSSQRIRCLSSEQLLLMIKESPSGLNEAIRAGISCLEVSEPWNVHFERYGWITTKTEHTTQSREQTLHYNFLTGELLVDNSPPGRFQRNTWSARFTKVFLARTLPVIPSSLPGSTFVLAQKIEDHEIHFGMMKGQLLVRSRKESRVLQLIPREPFLRDLPKALATDFFHWFDTETNVVEFRPLDQPWKHCTHNWQLTINADAPWKSFMRQDSKMLVDIHSPLFYKISSLLQTLDTKEHIIVVQIANQRIEAELTRLRLRFVVTEHGAMQCKELNAAVDRDQDVGCLYGLRDKLVLRGTDYPNQRSVVIPFGTPAITKMETHIQISIDRPSEKRVRYLHYSLDEYLQLLRGPPHLLASLYQAYLHALTSFPLADPLTHRSGTEEAFRILRQGSLRLPLPLDEDCLDMLEKIASLSTRFEYYPRHLKSMQTAHWKEGLGQLAQHEDFQIAAREIFNFSYQFSDFHPIMPDDRSVSYHGDTWLLDRARSLHAQFRCSEFGQMHIELTRPVYHSRDRDVMSDRSERVYEIAALVRDWPSTVHNSVSLMQVIKNLETVCTKISSLTDLTFTEILDLSISESWTSLYSVCRSCSRASDSYALTALFSMIAFGGKIEQSILRQLLLVSFSGQFAHLPPPFFPEAVLDLTQGEKFVAGQVNMAIGANYASFKPVHDASMTKRELKKKNKNLQNHWAIQKDTIVQLCCNAVQKQWPCEDPELPQRSLIPGIDRGQASRDCRYLCSRWMRNRQFFDFLRDLQHRMAPLHAHRITKAIVPNLPRHTGTIMHLSFQSPGLLSLIRCSTPPQNVVEPETIRLAYCGDGNSTHSTPELRELAQYFEESTNIHHRAYGLQLKQSIMAMDRTTEADYVRARIGSEVNEAETFQSCTLSLDPWASQDSVLRDQKRLQEGRDTLWSAIMKALGVDKRTEPVCIDAPSITVYSILSLLASREWSTIPAPWKDVLVTFGKVVSALRRCERLISCMASQDSDGFIKEAETVGCEGWDALVYPCWLLLEIENNITIRKGQVEVALEMMSPKGGENTVLQLNMGEGKTSVITPMIASVLSNGHDLLRVIVLKPLLRQSVGLLSQRLGGLIDRRVYHVPFSRRTPVGTSVVSKLKSIYHDCQRKQGVLIALPEQMLSFRLVGLDSVERHPDLFRPLFDLEIWLQRSCRDIIDESDEVLDTKFQLVYTVGTQQPLDGRAARWETTQHLLGLVARYARRVWQEDPTCIEVDQWSYRFPILRFLKAKAMKTLTAYLLQAIFQNGLPGIPFGQWTPSLRESVLTFIQHGEISEEHEDSVRAAFESGIFLPKLLVLRGLFAFRILNFALTQKRWMVDYGLHQSRCLMAVPFRAKGVPSENSEFGHPDIAIILTCLSYYYTGLTHEQLRDCFELLTKENDPSTEFQTWVAGVDDLPEGLRTFSGVNLEDSTVFEETLYPPLSYRKEVIDFYLTRFVFPREAKEFPRKLSTSAWDIPAQLGGQLTTGFSGTNDNRFLLPQSILQRDLPHLSHTNAMVLAHLLQERNRQCILAQDDGGRQLNVDELLELVCNKCSARVLIDVGAQILELGNQAVADKWLSMTRDAEVEAAIFFGRADEILVVDREGHVEPLLSSSYRQRMGTCLVFLDQHHSRGVDLKLPPESRAAVTLGPRLTKDRLVQACNRLRGLGKRQSVVFLVPPEVNHGMRALLGSTSNGVFTSADVLKWSMSQTCQSLDALRPLWAHHGLGYHRRMHFWNALTSHTRSQKETVRQIQESEARTLCQTYAPWGSVISISEPSTSQKWNVESPHIQELFQILQQSTSAHSGGIAYLHEEQEREIACEIQREQQVSRPPHYKPSKHEVHDDVRYFATYGKLQSGDLHTSTVFSLAFSTLLRTSADQTKYPSLLGRGLYVTADFAKTLQEDCTKDVLDEFMKPVNWVLSSRHTEDLLILSQYEANDLLPFIRNGQNTRLNIYAPRLSKPMRPFHRLDFFSVGADLSFDPPMQEMSRALELFAGSLYFTSFEEYKDFRSFLGLITDCLEIPDGGVSSDGFVDEPTRKMLQWPVDCPFESSPLPFLTALIHLRTKGQGYQQSHVGTVIEVKPLTVDRF